MNAEHAFDLAIIGCGATGVSFLKQLQEQLFSLGISGLRVLICDSENNFACGAAFGQRHPLPVVNTAPDLMNLSVHEPSSFADWLHHNNLKGVLYARRNTFADFITQQYNSIKKSHIIDITEVKESISAIVKKDGLFEITGSKSVKAAKKVVLSIGTVPCKRNAFLPNAIRTFHEAEQITDNSRIIIAGTSLSAIDFIRIVHKKNPKKVIAYSRTGSPPTCISTRHFYTPHHLSFAAVIALAKEMGVLTSFMYLLEKERSVIKERNIDEKEPALALLHEKGFTAYADFLITRAEYGILPYQDILFSTRNYMSSVWRSFSLEEKHRFNTVLRRDWMTWRHPIPLDVMKELKMYADNGTLLFTKGKNVAHSNGKFYLNDEYEADYFIEAIGGEENLTQTDHPLITSLFNNKLTEPNLAGGITIDSVTFRLMYQNRKIDGIYSLGPINSGALFATNALWFNVTCAYSLARSIAADIQESSV